jgi:hypothetical protein
VGTLRYDQQGVRESAVFEYDSGWLRRQLIRRILQ